MCIMFSVYELAQQNQLIQSELGRALERPTLWAGLSATPGNIGKHILELCLLNHLAVDKAYMVFVKPQNAKY